MGGGQFSASLRASVNGLFCNYDHGLNFVGWVPFFVVNLCRSSLPLNFFLVIIIKNGKPFGVAIEDFLEVSATEIFLGVLPYYWSFKMVERLKQLADKISKHYF